MIGMQVAENDQRDVVDSQVVEAYLGADYTNAETAG